MTTNNYNTGISEELFGIGYKFECAIYLTVILKEKAFTQTAVQNITKNFLNK